MNFNIPKSSLLLFGIVVLFAACKELIEPSISKKEIRLLAPANQYQSPKYAMLFWWDEVEDALHYRLQIVSGSFSSSGSLIQDTFITGNKFGINLDPGAYQWRVRAENGSSQTSYSTANDLYVMQSPLKNEAVQSLSPLTNYLTNQTKQTFQWSTLYGATEYTIEIDTNNFTNENKLVYVQKIQATSVDFNFPKDQTYQWRIRAENDSAQSKWSQVNLINYDHTPPDGVLLTSPANAQSSPLPLVLNWQVAPTAVKYKLYLFKSDATTNYNAGFPVIINTNKYTLNTALSGEKLFWCVSAIDNAGNEGPKSEMRNFLVQ